MSESAGSVLVDMSVATMVAGGTPYGFCPEGALVLQGGKILYAGSRSEMPDAFKAWPTESCMGALATPALIDCHTHLVHGGDRAEEFEQRLKGVSYAEIAAQGGGILSTVHATRDSSEADLIKSALPRLDALIGEGVATVEIKSGYGLDRDTELRMLRAARRLENERPIRVKTTFLAAHAIPPEFVNRADGYIDWVCEEVLPAAHAEGLVDAVDAFCESIAFTPVQVGRLFHAARALDLPVKIHAEQLSDLGGATLAAGFGALSADHLEYLSGPGIAAMAKAGSVAVLLPGAFYTLKETKLPPIQKLRTAGVPMAVATDCNPGSSPLTSPLLAMNMACTLFGMTPEEALAGTTRHAAAALGLLADRGTLEPGKRADIALWDIRHPAELSYRIGLNPLIRRIFSEEERE